MSLSFNTKKYIKIIASLMCVFALVPGSVHAFTTIAPQDGSFTTIAPQDSSVTTIAPQNGSVTTIAPTHHQDSSFTTIAPSYGGSSNYGSYGGSINYGGYSGYSSAYSYGTNGPSYTPRWNPNVGNWSASYQTNYAVNAPVPNTPAFVNGNGGEVDMSGWTTDYRLTYGTNTSTDYRVTCFVEDTTVRSGDDVEFSARAIGGSGDYEYEWFGDDGIDSSRDEFEHDFDHDGVYRVSVEVTDADGYTTSDDCDPIYVGQGYYGVNYVQDYGSPEGELANTSSVYLSQVPYTGVKDNAKIIGLVALVAVWSVALGYYFLKRRSTQAVSNRIADFKKANLASRI